MSIWRIGLTVSLLMFLSFGAAPAGPGGPAWEVSEDGREIVVDVDTLPDNAVLRRIGSTQPVMAKSKLRHEGGLLIRPEWPLMPAEEYQLQLEFSGAVETLRIALPLPSAAVEPGVVAAEPGTRNIPSNILRFHIIFATSMARGKVMKHVVLVDQTGVEVPYAFLDLGVELWSTDQKRLTVILDPGRQKQGVGPNRALGAVLDPGQSYTLIVEPGLRDAAGRVVAERFAQVYVASAPERRALQPADWRIAVCDDSITLQFDRLMDQAAVRHGLLLTHSPAAPAHEMPAETGDYWVKWYSKDRPIAPENVVLALAPDLEDAVGNRTCAAFDTRPNKAATCGWMLLQAAQRNSNTDAELAPTARDSGGKNTCSFSPLSVLTAPTND